MDPDGKFPRSYVIVYILPIELEREETSLPNPGQKIPGYSYGTTEVKTSQVSLSDLESLKVSAGFTEQDWQFLRLAGGVLADQTEKIVNQWRSGIIAGIPHLARHSRTLDNPVTDGTYPSQFRARSLSSGRVNAPSRQDVP